jgi:hypothetical protein
MAESLEESDVWFPEWDGEVSKILLRVNEAGIWESLDRGCMSRRRRKKKRSRGRGRGRVRERGRGLSEEEVLFSI